MRALKLMPLVLLLCSIPLLAQETTGPRILELNEFLAYVKKYHPVARQANLQLNSAQANLLQARGGFDPKIAVDYLRKDYKDTEYYDLLYGTFKIPTWFGIELQAGYELNDGLYLNPQNTVPEDGLYSAGISVPLGKGLFINERMAVLKQAKVFLSLSEMERDLLINQLISEAVMAYADWYRDFNELQLYSEFLGNAKQRFEGIKRQAEEGDKAAIDSVEAGINYQTRLLNLEQARLQWYKSSLYLSNFLWADNNIPLELQEEVIPDPDFKPKLANTLEINNFQPEAFNIADHPKVRALQLKLDALNIERRLKGEQLKPRIDLNYNLLTSDAEHLNTINTGDYKFGLSFEFPLFLRKERGALQLARFKLQDAQWETAQQTLALENKIKASRLEVNNYQVQLNQINTISRDYEQLLNAELRKFDLGESSVFLVNSRESSYLGARLKQIEMEWKLIRAQAILFQNMALEGEIETASGEDQP